MVALRPGGAAGETSPADDEVVSLLGGTRDGRIVTCPGHGYEFDLATGRCTHDPDLTLPCYKLSVIGPDIWVELFSLLGTE